jgi:chitodextrinase
LTKIKSITQRKPINVLLASVVTVLIVGAGYYVISSFAAAGAATLSLSPASLIVANNQTFTVDIREDSGSATVNAVQANLTYPSTSLEFVSVDATTSAFPLEAQSTGGGGSVTLARAINGGQTPLTGSQLVARVTFKSLMTVGSATVSFGAGSAVVSSVDNTALTLTTLTGTYAPDTTAPSVPGNLHTTAANGSSISLAWNASTDNVAVTGYNVYRDGIKVVTVVATSFTDTGLAMGTTHTYQVAAVDAAGNESTKSSVLTAATLDTAAPTVPTSPTGQALSYDQVKLNWTGSTDTGGSGLAGYKVYRNGGATAIASVATNTFTDTGRTGSTTYTYTVSAYDGAGNESAKTSSVSVTTPAPPDTTAPTTPVSFRMTANTLSSISLAWNASTDNVGVTGYQITRNGTLIASPTGLTYTDSSLTYGTTYTFTVKALDLAGNASTAATLSASTLPLKVGDLNLDNSVNVFDLSILLSSWNQTGTGVSGDLNHDNIVNIFDLSTLLSNWGA